MLTRVDKALAAGAGAAATAAATAQTQHASLEATAIAAVGSFIVVGLLAFVIPNKAAA